MTIDVTTMPSTGLLRSGTPHVPAYRMDILQGPISGRGSQTSSFRIATAGSSTITTAEVT